MNPRLKFSSFQVLCLVVFAVLVAETKVFAVSACLSARFTDYADFGCRLPPDPWKDLSIPAYDAHCEPCGGTAGMPRWWMSEPYINLWVADEPLSYFTSYGQRVSFRFTHRQRDNFGADFGRWRRESLVSDTAHTLTRYSWLLPANTGPAMTNAHWHHNWWSKIELWSTNEPATIPEWDPNTQQQTNAVRRFSGHWNAVVELANGGQLRRTDLSDVPKGEPQLVVLGAAGPEVPTIWGGGVRPYPTNGTFYLPETRYGFRLEYPDGSHDVYALALYHGNAFFNTAYGPSNQYTATFTLTERRDMQGRTFRLGYEWVGDATPNYRLRELADPDGRTNTYHYAGTNSGDWFQLERIEDPYGRVARFEFGLSDPGRLAAIVDAAGLTNRFGYQAPVGTGPYYSSGWLTNIITPYGTTSFTYFQEQESGATDEYMSRAILVTEPNNARQLFYYRHRCDNLVPGSATAPANVPNAAFDTGSTGSQHPALTYRNSFHWDRRQFAALSVVDWSNLGSALSQLNSNDFTKATMQHWLLGTDLISVSELSSRREPSPDAAGQIEGPRTWFDYAGKNANEPQIEGTELLPRYIARTLPDGTSQYVGFEFNASGYPSRQWETFTQTNGAVALRTNTFTWAANDTDLLSFTNAGVRRFSAAYNTNHQVTFITNALNEVTSISYVNLLTEQKPHVISLPSGQTLTLAYYQGYWTNISGTNVYVWLPDARFLKTIQWSPGPTWTFGYDKGLVKYATNDLGLWLAFTWDDLLRPTSVSFPDGSYVSNRYDKLDLSATRDRMGNWTYFGHDALQHLTRITNANQAVTQLSWCDCGGLESVTDALTNMTFLAYNNQGQVTNVAFPDNSSLKYFYDSVGRLTGIADGLNRTFTAGYNNQGLLTTVSNAYGQLERIVYDALDRPVQIADANNVTVTNTFDALGRLLTRGWPDGGVEIFGYTPNIYPATSYTNQLGSNVVNLAYDAALRLTNAVYPGIATNRFGYDTASRLQTLTDGKNQTTTWTYDIYGRTSNKVDAASHEVLRYGYDANGRLTSRLTPAKGNTAYAYDAVGNLTSVTYPAGTASILLGYDALNRLTSMVDGIGTNLFTWTAASQWQGEEGPWADDTISFSYLQRQRASLSLLQPGASAWTNGYGYDSARRLTSLASPAGTFSYLLGAKNPAGSLLQKLTLPGGAYITNEFDAAARLLSTTLKQSGGLTLNSHAYLYDLAGERTRQTFKAGNYMDYGYDLLGQLTSAKGKESGGAINRLQEQLNFVYDAAGNLNFRTNNALIQTFNLNSLNELTTATRSGTFTVGGNTTTPATNVTVNGSTASRYADNTFAKDGFTLADGNNTFTVIGENPYTFRVTNSLTVNLPATTTFAYDLNGNLRTNGNRIYDYDAENQLTTNWVAGEWKAEFVYDGFGRRRITRDYGWTGSAWSKTNETRYVYDGLLPIQERDGNNAVKVTYTRGRDLSGSLNRAGGIGGLLARTDAAGSVFYHADGGGNITALLNANQLIVGQYGYDPFGNLLRMSGPFAPGNVMRFSSKPVDLTGDYDFGLRRYRTDLPGFLTADPLGEAGGIPLHGFAGNNPISAIDPYGLEAGYTYDASGMHSGLDSPESAARMEAMLNNVFVPMADALFWLMDQTDQGINSMRTSDNPFTRGIGAGLWAGSWFLGGPERNALREAKAAEKLGAKACEAAKAAKTLTQAESSAVTKINNILTKNFKPGPKGDISGAIHDMVGNPIPKPGGGTYDHVQDLGNMLRGLRNNADALKNATDPAAVAARQQAQQAIQQIEQAIKGAGL